MDCVQMIYDVVGDMWDYDMGYIYIYIYNHKYIYIYIYDDDMGGDIWDVG